jgi:hypothetical protein
MQRVTYKSKQFILHLKTFKNTKILEFLVYFK